MDDRKTRPTKSKQSVNTRQRSVYLSLDIHEEISSSIKLLSMKVIWAKDNVNNYCIDHYLFNRPHRYRVIDSIVSRDPK